MLVRVGLRPVREYEGEIFTDYYFDEANTANKLDNQHNNAINENLNWGGFPGCDSSLPPTVDLVPRSRTIRGGGGREVGEKRETMIFNTTNKRFCSIPTTNFCREAFCRVTTTSKDEAIQRSRGGTTMVNDDQIEAFSLEVARIPGKRTKVKRRPRC